MFSIIRFEVKYYFNNLKELINLFGLLFSIIILYPFTQPGGKFEYQWAAAGILWIALISALSISSISLFKRDNDSGTLEAYQVMPISLERVVLSKWIAFYISILIPFSAVLPFVFLLLDIPAQQWIHYSIGLIAGSMALSLLVALSAALMAGLERAGAVLSLIVLPLSIPIVIFGTDYLAKTNHQWQPGLLFLIGFSLLLLPALCLVGASCIRSSN